MIENIIGFIAAFCIAANMFPQIFKSFKTKKSEDISLIMILFVLLGSFLWFIYGIMILSWPIIFSDTLGTLTSIILLGIKLKYSGNK